MLGRLVHAQGAALAIPIRDPASSVPGPASPIGVKLRLEANYGRRFPDISANAGAISNAGRLPASISTGRSPDRPYPRQLRGGWLSQDFSIRTRENTAALGSSSAVLPPGPAIQENVPSLHIPLPSKRTPNRNGPDSGHPDASAGKMRAPQCQ